MGGTQKKLLLILLGGVALSLSGSPRRYFRVLKSIGREWRKINEYNLKRSIRSLYKSKLVREEVAKDGIIRLVLTEKGKLKALAYNIETMKIRSPRIWDKKWRMVVFDIPETLKSKREILRYHLKNLGFFELQKSVFVHPFDCYNEIEYIVEFYRLRKYLRFIVAESIDVDLLLREHFLLK